MNREHRRQNRLKWGLALVGIGLLLGSLVIFGGVLVFRGLSPDLQDRIVKRIPLLEILLPPTGDLQALLPTVVAPTINPASLLETVAPQTPFVPTPTRTIETITAPPSLTAAAILPSATAQPVASETAAPSATFTFTALPTETSIPIPATHTQVPPTFTPTFSGFELLPSFTPEFQSTTVPSATVTLVLPTETPVPTFTPSLLPTFPATNTLPPAPSATFTPELPTNTVIPSPSLIPTLAPTNTPFPLPRSYRVQGRLSWEPQLWNNCGPANLIQAMRYYGWREGQYEVGAFLKPTQADKNVSPWELVRYVNTRTNLRAVSRQAGNLDLVKQLVSRDIMVILETGFYDPEDPEEGWIGHYLTVTAYDDTQGILWKLDTLRGETNQYYPLIDEWWSHFNREYIVVYPPSRHEEVMAILGPDADPTYNAQHALEIAHFEAGRSPQNPFAWFNVGTSLVALGRYQEAAQAYDVAYTVGGAEGVPYRMMWYQFGPFEAYYQARRYDFALALINATIITSKENVEEMFYWRAMVEAAQGNTTAAKEDFLRALAYNGNFTPAFDALAAVESGAFKPPEG